MRRPFFFFGACLLASVLVVPSSNDHQVFADAGFDSAAWAYATQCLADNGALQVEIVADVSSSLAKTDPTTGLTGFEQRNRLLKAWLQRLTNQSTSGSEVSVSLASYGSQWLERLPWTALTSESIGLAFQVVDKLGYEEEDTDHVLAILNADQVLQTESARLASIGKTPCPMLLWFTDGQYDFGKNSERYRRAKHIPLRAAYSDLRIRGNEAAIMQIGRGLLCGASGPALRLRSINTSIIGVSLNLALDFRLVNEIATGEGYADSDSSGGCDLPRYPHGTYVTTDGGGEPTTSIGGLPPGCETTDCTATQSVKVPASADVAQVTLRLPAQASGKPPDSPSFESLELTSPSGELVSASPLAKGTRSLTLAGAEILLVRLDSESVQATIKRVVGHGIGGEWKFSTVVPGAHESLSVSSTFLANVRAKLVSPKSLVVGKPTSVSVELSSAIGGPLTADLASSISASVATPDEAPISLRRSSGSQYSFELPARFAASEADALELTLRMTTNDLVEIPATTVQVPILRPAYPTIRFPLSLGGVVRPATFDTPGSATVTYTVTGPLQGEGCVTPAPVSFAYGSDKSAVATFLSPKKECFSPGETRTFDVTLNVLSRFRGPICGSLTFSLDGSNADSARTFSQPVCLTVERSVTWVTRLLAMLMGFLVLLPLLFLGLLNLWNGRLPRPPRLAVASVPVDVSRSPNIARTEHALLVEDIDFGSGGVTVTGRTMSLREAGVRIETRSITTPRANHRGVPSLVMLLTGPRNYLTAAASSVIVGSGSTVLGTGTVTEPIQLPRDLDSLWIISNPTREGQGNGRVVAQLTVLRVRNGRGMKMDSLRNAISDGATLSLRQDLIESMTQSEAGTYDF